MPPTADTPITAQPKAPHTLYIIDYAQHGLPPLPRKAPAGVDKVRAECDAVARLCGWV